MFKDYEKSLNAIFAEEKDDITTKLELQLQSVLSTTEQLSGGGGNGGGGATGGGSEGGGPT